MNIINSLKKLYTSLGGNADTVKDVQTAPDMVEALAGIASSTIELPAVDAEDNGKVLKVKDGKWAKGTDESLPDVTTEDAGDVLTVGEDGKWTNEEPAKELPTVTASDNGYSLMVSRGKWNKQMLIGKREATVTLSDTAASMDFSLGSVGNKTPVGIQVSDMATQYKLANVNFKTEMVFSLNPNANNYVRLTVPEGSTFQAGTYKIFIIYLDQDNLGVF